MNENLKTGLLIGFSILTLANTVMILSDDSVSYDRSSANKSSSTPIESNTAINSPALNNEATVIEEDLGPKTSIQFAEMEHDFGTIDQNTRQFHSFVYSIYAFLC